MMQRSAGCGDGPAQGWKKTAPKVEEEERIGLGGLFCKIGVRMRKSGRRSAERQPTSGRTRV